MTSWPIETPTTGWSVTCIASMWSAFRSARRSSSMAGENWTMWLNITNFALGMITLIALLVVFFAVGWDLLVRKVGRAPQVDLSNVDADLRRPAHFAN